MNMIDLLGSQDLFRFFPVVGLYIGALMVYLKMGQGMARYMMMGALVGVSVFFLRGLELFIPVITLVFFSYKIYTEGQTSEGSP